MMIDCWPQKKWRDSCCSIFSIMGVRSGSVRYQRQKRLIWRKVAFCVARKLARSDIGGQEGRSPPFYHSASTLLMPCSSWSSTLLLRTLLSDGKLRQRRLEMVATRSMNSRILIKKSILWDKISFSKRRSPMISDIASYNSNFIHFIFSLIFSRLNGSPGEFNFLALWRTLLWGADLIFVKKNYTNRFSGKKIYTLKVRKFWLFLLKKKQRECINISYFSSFFC